MGSGKTFECVVSVIIPAIKVGRRVITNVDGIDNDAIRAYCQEKFDIEPSKLGSVVHCKNDDVHKENFLPHGADVPTFVQAGDLVCIDEAWRFWGTGSKILKEHAIFFREHRHFVSDFTKVSCDLVLMVQDISDLHRTLKVVVELSFRTTKIKSLGFDKLYRVEMWEGFKQTAKARNSVENKKYDPEIFPLYSSYVGGNGKELQVDARQNILRSPKVWGILLLMAVTLPTSIYFVLKFFTPKESNYKKTTTSANANIPEKANENRKTQGLSHTQPSETWRVVGILSAGNKRLIVLQGANSQIRVEHPSLFQGDGITIIGEVDGETLSTWSGKNSTNSMLPEVKK